MSLATAAQTRPTASAAGPRPPRAQRVGRGLVVLAAYVGVSVAVWWQVWSGHPTSAMTCGCGDPSLFLSSFAWLGHALGHGQDPFLSTAVFHPAGLNLLANTSGMLEAMLLAPVTAVFGPVASLNVADTLAPALSAAATYWAVRRLGSGRAGAFVAGLIVEVSPAVIGSVALSHLQLGMLAFVPIVGTCLHELLAVQRSRPWRWGALLAAAAVGQFFAGTELFAVLALFSAVVVAVAAATWAVGVARGSAGAAARARHAAVGLGVGAGGAAVLLAVPAWFALAGPRHVSGEPWPGLMGFSGGRLDAAVVTPPPSSAADTLVRMSGYLGPFGAPIDHLGWAAVIAAVVAAVVLRRRLVVWALVAVAVGALWCSLGAVWEPLEASRPGWVPFLPWATLGRLPILRDALAQNVAVITVVAVAMLVGLLVDRIWALGRERPRPGALGAAAAATALAAVVVVPLVTAWDLPLTSAPVRPPTWFTRDAPRLPAGSVVLAEPFVGAPGEGEAAVWQAMGHLHFALAGGFGLVPGPDGKADHGTTPGSATVALDALGAGTSGAPRPALTDAAAMATVRAAMASWGVTTVVVTDRIPDQAYAVRWFTALVGRPPVVQDGADVWTVAPSAGAAPAPGSR